GHGVEQQGRVLGGAGQGAGLIQTGGKGNHAPARYPAVSGFEPGETAECGGLTDGAPGIAGGGAGSQLSRHSGGRAARGSTGNTIGGPGIFDRAVKTGFIG